MNLLFKGILANCLVLPLALSVNAATLNGVIEGQSLRWQNAQQQGEWLTLTNWQPISGIEPTSEWIPGTFMTQPGSEIILSNSNGEQVQIPFTVAGLEYGLGQAADVFSLVPNGYLGGAVCADSELSATSAKVVGAQCVANQAYKTASSSLMYTPYQFVRPIYETNSEDIIAAFRDAGVGSGQYVGTTMVSPAYMFKSPTGTWTYRQASSVPMTVSLRYIAANLESVEVQGDGIIEPTYDTVNYTVSGETYFHVTAKGNFVQGVKLSFDDVDYSMEAGIDEALPLPYSISCIECEDTNVVNEGVLQLHDGETVVGKEQNESVSFKLRVHYDDVAGDRLETGQYRGEFNVYFEAAL
ncbi:hypothetical protein [Vibrio paucivorans]|uniref:Fimbrial protein n=1 Tax=Vibrio paucivorans TaxID=2829489 RepID=A0A9X3HT80_9VIBR|nr:hypothetical protein [Vibrio paucivorans]MCW8335439.1 hypothetical protein [Vibrio paucivorans]